ncbi:hypothetical protein N7281_04250 [Rickettsia hoogstraalii]|nr:hypothetical protein [Rickettsia hoogstraalii]MCX4084068.1 hypothetical protein [Rickettsia hoogstraalii]
MGHVYYVKKMLPSLQELVFPSLREELRSNSTKQSSKKFCKSEFF